MADLDVAADSSGDEGCLSISSGEEGSTPEDDDSDPPSLVELIAEWQQTRHIPDNAMEELLKILVDLAYVNLPVTCEGLRNAAERAHNQRFPPPDDDAESSADDQSLSWLVQV